MRASAARSSRACISAEPVDCQAAATWTTARERAPRAPRPACPRDDRRPAAAPPGRDPDAIGRPRVRRRAPLPAPRPRAARRREAPSMVARTARSMPAHQPYQGACSSVASASNALTRAIDAATSPTPRWSHGQAEVRAQEALAIPAASASRSTSRLSARVLGPSTMSISAATAVVQRVEQGASRHRDDARSRSPRAPRRTGSVAVGWAAAPRPAARAGARAGRCRRRGAPPAIPRASRPAPDPRRRS